MKVVSLSALHAVRHYPPGNIPGTHFCQMLSRPKGHSEAGRIMSMKNPNETIENRTRDLQACSALHQLRHRVPPAITLCIFQNTRSQPKYRSLDTAGRTLSRKSEIHFH